MDLFALSIFQGLVSAKSAVRIPIANKTWLLVQVDDLPLFSKAHVRVLDELPSQSLLGKSEDEAPFVS